MMRAINNKKNVKIFSLIIAVIFILGIGGLAYTQMSTPGATGSSTVGVIDTSRMMSPENPIFIKAANDFMTYRNQVSTDAQAKIDAAPDDATKQQIAEEAQTNIAKRDQEIAKEVQDKAMEAAKAVGESKGLSVIMAKDSVLYGGVDITEQVLKKMAADAQ
ncbi:OmpH family outer membrane protein [Veillonella agrestimuris]|uniref:OmpH family outer membrane protein n=1 Tax=Veillonella agrestimuris TaxID=2941340 RepID=UPI002041641C|nr:OmpH family outer membrane protein [Veillonella agrestimuris]